MNFLVDDIEKQMKIEKGLKVLQFGTEYLLHKAYLRNCPFNNTSSNETKNDRNKNMDEKGDIIAQLNDFLINPQGYNKTTLKQPNNKITRRDVEKNDGASKSDFKEQKLSEFGGKVGSKLVESKFRKNKVEQNQYQEKVEGKVGQGQEQIKVKSAQGISSKDSPNKAVVSKTSSKNEDSQNSLSDYDSGEEGIDFPEEKPSKQNDDKLDPKDLKSFHSDTRTLEKIVQASVEDSKSSIISPHIESKIIQEKSKYYTLADFDSVEKGTINNSVSVRNTKKPVQSSIGCQYPSELSMKRSKKSSMGSSSSSRKQEKSIQDKSISQVLESKSSNHGIFDERHNQTELNILREISGLNDQDQNMKNLLKLENFELQEKYILQQMDKRLQNCGKQINKIRQISWQSLKMPKEEIHFKRPNYAHCFDMLK